MSQTLLRLREYDWLLVAGILLLALTARLGAVVYLGVPDLVESSESGNVAFRLVTGRGYTFDLYGYRVANPLRSFMPPLYTVFVASFIRFAPEPATALGVVQAFLASLTCVLVYYTAKDLAGGTVGALSGGAMAVYPVFVVQAARPFSLTLHTFVLALLMWLLLVLLQRAGPITSAAAGIMAGLSVLGRSSMLGFIVAIVGWLWLNRGSIPQWYRSAALIVLFALLVLLPWTLRNYRLHNQFVLVSTNGGFTLWNGNNPFTTGNAFDVYVDKVQSYLGIEAVGRADEQTIMDMRPYPLPREVLPDVDSLSEVELDRALYRAGWQFIRENPRAWLRLVKAKLVSFWWFRPHMGQSRADLGEHGLVYDPGWITPYKLLYATVFPFFLGGVVLSLRHWRPYSIFYLLFGYLTIVYAAFNVMTRYRWEIEPYILFFAILAVVYLAQRTSKEAVPEKSGLAVARRQGPVDRDPGR